MKPKIFIGSSSEGYAKARLVKKNLSRVGDCQLWNEGFFELNRSSFESLCEGSVLFDFAILVATADDAQLKRKDLQIIARDNIIFEFGLYIGRLGRNRAFLLKEKGLDLPSDLFGITVPEFTLNGTGPTLDKTCEQLKTVIRSRSKLFELSFIPSTAIAIGYFENLVVKVCRELINAPKRMVNGKDYASFLLHVVIPDELPDDFNDQVISWLNKEKLTQMKVDTSTRAYNFYLRYSEQDKEVLNVYDIPTTLSAVKKSIEMAIPKGYIGESERERILKKKEMYNFYRTLEYLVNENPVTRDNVKIIFIDVKNNS